jgi:hypothetical protein
VAGIHVEGSYAWAHFNIDDNVVSEGVFWPPIPQSVVDEAVAFAATLSDGASQAAYAAKLPPHLQQKKGRLIIRHSGGHWAGPLETQACYAIAVGRGEFFYGRDGNRVMTEEERQAQVVAPSAAK